MYICVTDKTMHSFHCLPGFEEHNRNKLKIKYVVHYCPSLTAKTALPTFKKVPKFFPSRILHDADTLCRSDPAGVLLLGWRQCLCVCAVSPTTQCRGLHGDRSQRGAGQSILPPCLPINYQTQHKFCLRAHLLSCPLCGGITFY